MSNITPITFEKASPKHRENVFEWLEAPHVKEFWDNSQNHRDDILIFMDGRKEPSPYFDGIFDYWIGLINNDPYCLVMTSEILPTQTDLSDLWKSNLSKNGKTFSIDFMIGHQKYFGKGLAAPTLEAFTDFIKDKFYPSVDTFFIDPEESNGRAKHVYEKAGFNYVADFHRDSNGEKDVRHFLMVKKLYSDTSMPLECVVDFVIQMKNLNVKVWIDGGWGVDALLGKQTRPHGDLDIAIEYKDVEKALQLLKMQGYKEIRRDNEWNFVVGDDLGHEIDFHIFVFDDQGKIVDGLKYPEESLTGTGIIGDCVVACISPHHLVQFHTDYPLRKSDYHDVSLLCEKFGIEYPKEYAHLKKTKNAIRFLHPFKVEKISPENQEQMIAFLRDHDDYSLFLLGNFENYGSSLADAPYSGNYKLIRSDNEIIAVFCLTKKGSLLIQSVVRDPIFDIVLASCHEEKISITGLVGDWEFCHVFWQFLKDKKIIQTEAFTSKEILYHTNVSQIFPIPQPNVRFLIADDYTQWKPLRLDYLKEEGFPNDLNDEQLLEIFIDKCNKKIIWGLFLKDQLVSIADLNAKAFDLGQLGGVYTDPKFRKMGYSKSVIHKLLADLKDIHDIQKLIIFTGENNTPAQKLYESVGVKPVGYFALLFGK